MNSTPRDENVLTDIRTCQEIVAKSHNDKIAAICRILQGCAMPDTSGMAQSLFENGLDCLTLVCRTNLSRYVSHSFNPSPVEQADQEKNPVLPFLWSSLNLVKHPDDEHHRLEALEILSNAKQDILRRIIALGLLDSKNLDFLSLNDSDIMNETLWSQPQFRLYDTVIRREQGEREWHLVPRPGRREQGQRSLLSLCAAEDPHQPLQEFIDSNIGPRDCEDGSQEIWMSDKPRIVRIQYEPCANAPANFQELRRFDMPIYNCKEAVAWANIRPDILKAHVSWHYELGSVVKVGATARHNSYVRTYSQGGGHRRLDARGTKTVNNLWKLDGATSGVYLLVYHWTAHEQSQIYSAEVQPKYGSDRITGADGVELINGFLNKLDLEEPSAESQNVGDTNTASSARPATGNRNVPVDAGTAQPDNPVPVQDQGDPRQSQPEPARPSDASHPSRNVRNETQEQSSSRRGTLPFVREIAVDLGTDALPKWKTIARRRQIVESAHIVSTGDPAAVTTLLSVEAREAQGEIVALWSTTDATPVIHGLPDAEIRERPTDAVTSARARARLPGMRDPTAAGTAGLLDVESREMPTDAAGHARRTTSTTSRLTKATDLLRHPSAHKGGVGALRGENGRDKDAAIERFLCL
ncbi:hypothetical protein MAC_02009 [Metarhizium acridum CQMa 102]|uniref:Uncharacterized protein n=1 Tax=Metarhizium acridum (strain CQMa 102) TaxID=655827 RepID=E9DWL1_METAQ|nr:uncharacterized protein MAC_02009 [Metarhizium acridum CQMa 102]EFY92061.1 hypothetical protein MAC_02009 [Metarhizium acridum CQMa 102]